MPTRKTITAIACCLLGGVATAAAVDIPAVNLPPGTPDTVRDSVARSLALGRDTLGWAVHPFRGEFHGLGINPTGSSYAIDLSGDGRVVVGREWDSLTRSNRPFVWSPADGRTFYNMLPGGVTGSATPTSISADGVYVAGVIDINYGGPAFRWSLAGPEKLISVESKDVHPAALSGNGGVLVGTYSTPLVNTSGLFLDLDGATNYPYRSSRSWAFRYTRVGGIDEAGVLTNGGIDYYVDSNAADISYDGKTVLVNGLNHTADRSSEPFLWKKDGSLHPLGKAPLAFLAPAWLSLPAFGTTSTTASAISADGSTVVGVASLNSYVSPPGDSYFGNKAVLWRETTGWIDLGELKTTADRSFIGAEATGVSGDGTMVLGRSYISERRTPIYDDSGLPFDYEGATVSSRSPFLWDEAHGMRELADVLRLDYGLDLSGWTLNEATGISDDGTTIIGNGRNPAGQGEAWRAVLHRNTPLGDIDFDGDVDQVDYQRLTGNLGVTADDGAVFYADGDLNADGRVDELDVMAFMDASPYRVRGDFNADGVVNAADYTVWRDFLTSDADFTAWRSHFGQLVGSILPWSVPEPSALWLLAAATLGLSRRR